MKLAIETMICSLIISLMVLLGMYMNNVNIATGNAKQFCSAVSNRMEAADLAKEVQDACVQEAMEAGYKSLTFVETSGKLKITLTYQVEIPLFHMNKTYSVVQYAVDNE